MGGQPTRTVADRPPGCVPAVAHAVGLGVRATPSPPSPGLSGCRYEAPGRPPVVVSVDANPQARTRFARAVEEEGQVAVWAHRPRAAPRMLEGIGAGADWLATKGLLLSTDGARLVRVHVEPGHGALDLARRVTVATIAVLRRPK